MKKIVKKENWEKYQKNELSTMLPILQKLGFDIDTEQLHTSGERYLMSGYKLVLTGKQISSNKKVIIKTSSHPEGIKEIAHGHNTQNSLNNLHFVYRMFLYPEELFFLQNKKYIISITSYIEQTKSFMEHSLIDQFFLAIRSFEIQEGAHDTASSHTKAIQNIFKTTTAEDYITSFETFNTNIIANNSSSKELCSALNDAKILLKKNKHILQTYSDFLTHYDFVPHNLRVIDRDIYLLDHTSIKFGNKYEGWARFINFMTLHNPQLEQYLLKYVRENKSKSEYLSLRLMRIYILGFLINFYTDALENTTDNLYKLTQARICFWTQVLQSVLSDKIIDTKIRDEYINKRDSLRSKSEKKRQQEILSKKI